MKTVSKRILILILALVATSAAIDEFYAMHFIRPPLAWDIASTLILAVTIFSWYYFDSTETNFHRSKWLNIAVAGFGVVGIPVYLFRSRARRRVSAFGKLLGFLALSIVASTIGVLLADFLG